MTHDELREFIEKKVAEIHEHCDAVQVLVSWNEEGVTRDLFSGAGNWYARQGMAREFVIRNKAQEFARQIKDSQPPPATEGDEWKADEQV